MPRAPSSLELTYESFDRIWKALVSKRKARKLDVDVASAWRQLSDAGGGAGFLRLHAEAKAAKAERERTAEVGKRATATRKESRIAPPADRAGDEIPTRTKRRASRKIATGIERGPKEKAATSKKRGTRRKAARR